MSRFLYHFTRARILFAVFLFGLFLVPLTPVFAAGIPIACDCYCASDAGAIPLSEKKTPDTCKTECKKKGSTVVVCAAIVDQSPERSPYCFTADLCKKQNGILDGKQTRDCIPGQRYCYPDPAKAEKVKLNVAIGSYKVAGDIGEYINMFFAFILNAGIVISVVMVMIGGLQYALGAASSDMVGAGKKRMTDAVIGLVLLSCIYLILQTVNPALLKLQPPGFPMIKRADLIDSASCEDLEKDHILKTVEGGEIFDNVKFCGMSAKVVSKKDGSSVTGATTCDYKKCQDPLKGCLGTGKNAKCVSCEEIAPNNSMKIAPSTSVCSELGVSMKTNDTDSGGFPNQRNYCFFSRDTDLLFAIPSFQIGKDLALISVFPIGTALGAYWTAEKVDIMNQGTCAEMTIQCAAITKCDDYDDVHVTGGGHTTDLDTIDNNARDNLVNFGDLNLEKICLQDPCRIAERFNNNKKCVFDKKSVLNPVNDACDNPSN